MSKPRVVKDYDKLDQAIQEQIKLVYPHGFKKHLVSFVNKEGEKKMGLPFETEDRYYLVRMTETKAKRIIEEDIDFDEDGNLKAKARSKYEDKYDDVDYLSDLNANEDNAFDDMTDDEDLNDSPDDDVDFDDTADED